MKTIDARGLACPKPLQLAEEALSSTGEGIVEILVDNESAIQNLEWLGNKLGIYTENEARKGYWAVKFVKGASCKSTLSTPEKEKTAKSLMLVISTDSFGKDEALGKNLVKAFFETMLVRKDLPDRIFFLNAGVKLTTTEEEVISILKKISENVEIFSCGTCLDYFGLKDSLKVGMRGTSDVLVCGLKDSDKTVWI